MFEGTTKKSTVPLPPAIENPLQTMQTVMDNQKRRESKENLADPIKY
jgi:hypothetical protein